MRPHSSKTDNRQIEGAGKLVHFAYAILSFFFSSTFQVMEFRNPLYAPHLHQHVCTCVRHEVSTHLFPSFNIVVSKNATSKNRKCPFTLYSGLPNGNRLIETSQRNHKKIIFS